MKPILPTVIQEVDQKISAPAFPHGFSVNPVLPHINGVALTLLSKEYFSAIIDFSQLLLPIDR